MTDIDPVLDARLIGKIQAACRNVKLSRSGYFVRGKRRDNWPANDWRSYYEKLMRKLFPNGWVYRGGHHVAVHASPPAQPKRSWSEPDGRAGRLLFIIKET